MTLLDCLPAELLDALCAECSDPFDGDPRCRCCNAHPECCRANDTLGDQDDQHPPLP